MQDTDEISNAARNKLDGRLRFFGLVLCWLCIPAYAFEFWYYFGDSASRHISLFDFFSFIAMLLVMEFTAEAAGSWFPRRYLRAFLLAIGELAVLVLLLTHIGFPLLLTLCFVQAVIGGVLLGVAGYEPRPSQPQ